jgi:hypothetical protein
VAASVVDITDDGSGRTSQRPFLSAPTAEHYSCGAPEWRLDGLAREGAGMLEERPLTPVDGR